MMLYVEGNEECLRGHSLKGINAKSHKGMSGLKECRACTREDNKEVAMTTETTGKVPATEFSHAPGTTKTVSVPAKHPEDEDTRTLAEKQAEYMFDDEGLPKVYAEKQWGHEKGKPDIYYAGQKYLIPDDTSESLAAAKKKQGKKWETRECYRSFIHNPHVYKSHILGFMTECKGTGEPPAYVYSSGYIAKTQTKYNTVEWGTVDEEGNVLPMSIERARKIAFDMHKDQKDKIGKEYRGHLQAVYEGVKVLGGSKDEQIAALFHDSEEDLHTTFKHLAEIGVSENAILMIKAVSKNTGEEQGKYLQRIIDAGEGAMRVKLADLLHNTRHDRMTELREKTGGEAIATRLLKKYRPAMARLMLELGMLITEDEQTKLATKPVGSSGSYSYTTTGGKNSTVSTPSKSKKKGPVPAKLHITTKCLTKGDWIIGQPAPVLGKAFGAESAKDFTAYALANGQIVELDARLWVKHHLYAYNDWATDARITFEGVEESDIGNFITICDTYEDVKTDG